jgi:hypothetical protein
VPPRAVAHAGGGDGRSDCHSDGHRDGRGGDSGGDSDSSAEYTVRATLALCGSTLRRLGRVRLAGPVDLSLAIS